MTETPLLEMREIEKSFFGVKVLDNVSITCTPAKCWRCWAKTARANPR